MHCISSITGYNSINFEKPIPDISTNANIIIVEIRKFIAPLITLDIGKISLGKYTFLLYYHL